MFQVKLKKCIQAFIGMFLLGLVFEYGTPIAEGRAGGGSSRGRSSGWGSRPSTPSKAPPSQAQPAGNPSGGPGMTPPANNPGGGFMRSMAGGIAGGFLGSMLFGSIGHAAGLGGAGGGGVGLVEILLLAGVAYFGFRWWKGRQLATNTSSAAPLRFNSSNFATARGQEPTFIGSQAMEALPPIGIDTEKASDLFFQVQGAWTRRNLSSVKSLLGRELAEMLETDLAELREKKLINRLENISIRTTDVLTSWSEGGEDFSTVRFTANLLDYKVDESTGKVTEGSDSQPVKFAEDWTYAKSPRGHEWRLESIEQV